MPEGPLVLARPTTVLWLEELSEDAVLAAMKAGRGYVTEGPGGPHLAISAGSAGMGGTVPAGPLRAEAEVRGAAGDTLVWIDASGPLRAEPVAGDDWRGGFEGAPERFLRAEIVADASLPRLLQATAGRPLPAGLTEAEIAAHPFRRALSNPIFMG
jgi:hypothetical protein